MPSENAIGAAPSITGLLLAVEAASAIARNGLAPWSVLGFVGGCAALRIGLGILLDRNAIERDSTRSRRPSAPTLVVAGAAFLVGVAIHVA